MNLEYPYTDKQRKNLELFNLVQLQIDLKKDLDKAEHHKQDLMDQIYQLGCTRIGISLQAALSLGTDEIYNGTFAFKAGISERNQTTVIRLWEQRLQIHEKIQMLMTMIERVQNRIYNS